MRSLDFENDIPESLACAAHSGTSMVPERRAVQERASYAQELRTDYEGFRQHAEQGGTLSRLEQEFARYRQGVARRTRNYLQGKSRCLSWMITGPSRFPTARNRKRSDAAHKKLEELLDFQQRARAAIIRTLRPDLQPVRTSDSDAIERLQKELVTLEGVQERMKAANAAIRKRAKDGAAAQVGALMALEFTQKAAEKLLQPDFTGSLGFAGYQIQNNNANIRRIRARIDEIKAVQAVPATEVQGTMARVEDDPPANRIRLFFPSKPAPEVIATLKSRAFRWTPSLGCWQAYRNSNSITLAHRLAGANGEGHPSHRKTVRLAPLAVWRGIGDDSSPFNAP